MDDSTLAKFEASFHVMHTGFRLNGVPSACWIWTRLANGAGYGILWVSNGRRIWRAHRLGYEHFVGPIPDDLACDHLCRVRPCCNPSHIELVTAAENTRRGRAGSLLPQNGNAAKLRARTHCAKAGHPLSEDNLIIMPKGYRNCRACAREASKRRYRTKNLSAQWNAAVRSIVISVVADMTSAFSTRDVTERVHAFLPLADPISISSHVVALKRAGALRSESTARCLLYSLAVDPRALDPLGGNWSDPSSW